MSGLEFGLPLVAEDGVDVEVVEDAFGVEGLAEGAFAFHADFFHDSGGGGVVGDAAGFDAVEVEGAEGVIEGGAEGFGGESLAPVGGGEGVVDFGLVVEGLVFGEAEGADEGVGGFEDDGPGGLVAALVAVEAKVDKAVGVGDGGVVVPGGESGDGGVGGVLV